MRDVFAVIGVIVVVVLVLAALLLCYWAAIPFFAPIDDIGGR